MIINKYIKLLIFLCLCFLSGFVIYKYHIKYRPIIENIMKKNNNNDVSVEIISAVSSPYTEKIKGSGIASRDKITYMANNFQTIKYIVPKSTTIVKKGTVLFQYEVGDLEARRDKLLSELKLKKEILKRNEELDTYSVIPKDELNKIQIEVASSTGELNEIMYRLETSVQTAPFDCFVKHHDLITGANIKSGDDILTIFKNDKINVELNINLRDLTNLVEQNLLNKHASMSFINNRKVAGKVVYFIKNVDKYTASLPVSIEIESDSSQITSGEICDVKIYTGHIFRYFIVPEEAICGEDYNFHVFIIKNGVAYKTDVKKHGIKNNQIIISGINEGDLLVVSGTHRLNNLTKVRI